MFLGASLAAAVGCSSTVPPKPADTAGNGPSSVSVEVTPGTTARQDTVTPTSGSIHIEERIMKACGDVPTAHFAFDSAKIQPDAGAALDAIARCFVGGPLNDKGIKLIGHADPRGEHEYNFGLGQKRAGSVGAYLSVKGLPASREQTSSKGDSDAVGTDEAGWARDRKVDILLAD
jgi:peptidoglycan-associated lipoprotein